MDLNIILDKVGELYSRYGIKSITMDDLSHELGISKKTLYQYVTDKSDLVHKVTRNLMEKEREKFTRLLSKNFNAIEELIEVNHFIRNMIVNSNPSAEYDLKKYYPALFKEVRELKVSHMYASVLRNLKKGIKEGLYRKELNAEFIAMYYVARIESNMNFESFRSNPAQFKEYLIEVFIYHIRGISSKKGIEFLEQHIDDIKIDNHV